ncbi:MAG: acyltransferase [Dysgonomonas sp.]
MEIVKFKEKIKQNPKLAKLLLTMLMHPVKTRPRKWVRIFLQPFYMKRGKRSIIYRSARRDIVPFNHFRIGDRVVIEDFSTVNNAVGDIVIGNDSRIGIGCVLIGPVQVGCNVHLAQHILLSGLNHKYEDVDTIIEAQGVGTSLIVVEDDVVIGANAVVVAGVIIGRHSMIGAGSVVTRNIPPYSVAVGNPAKVIKKYDFESKQWIKA